MLAARYLGVKDFGVYAFIKVIGMTLSPIITFGVLRILIREISVKKEKATLLVCSGLMVNTLMLIVVSMIAFIVAQIFDLTTTILLISLYLTLLSQALMVMTNTVGSVFIAYEKMAYDFFVTIVVRIAGLFFFGIAIFCDVGLIGLFFSLVVADLLGLIIAIILLSCRFSEFKWSLDFQYLSYLFKECYLLAASSFLSLAYTHINVFLLKLFWNTTQISLFQAPQRIIQPLLLIPRSFSLAFVPVFSRMADRGEPYSDLKNAYHRTAKYILIFIFPLCVFGTAYAPWIISIVLGNAFSEAIFPFQILVWTLVPLFINIFLDFILISMRQQNVLVVGNGLSLGVSFTIGLLLVQKYGYLGACWATLLSHGVLVTCNYYFVSKCLGLLPAYRVILPPAIASSAMGAMLIGYSNTIHIILLSIGAAGAYMGLIFLMKGITREELVFLKQAVLLNIKKRCWQSGPVPKNTKGE